jgi:short-subunit dehydrogenase
MSRSLHVVITGASSGIGKTTARAFVAAGHRVVLAARRSELLEPLAKELDPSGQRVLVVTCDVRQTKQLEALLQAARAKFGVVQVLVNNAGVDTEDTAWWNAPEETIDQVLETNAIAPFYLSRLVLPEMLAAQYGHIINIGSVAGQIAVSSLYSASKFALRGMSLSLRRELLGTGVHVSLVSPGYIRTPMTQNAQDGGFPMAEPEVVARAILGLLERPRAEVIVPWWYQLLIGLERLLPFIGDRIVQPKKG